MASLLWPLPWWWEHSIDSHTACGLRPWFRRRLTVDRSSLCWCTWKASLICRQVIFAASTLWPTSIAWAAHRWLLLVFPTCSSSSGRSSSSGVELVDSICLGMETGAVLLGFFRRFHDRYLVFKKLSKIVCVFCKFCLEFVRHWNGSISNHIWAEDFCNNTQAKRIGYI